MKGFLPEERLRSSFRDPAGHMIRRGGELLRLVRPAGLLDQEALHKSGLYDALVSSGRLVPYEAVDGAPEGHRLLRPQIVPFVSYPYEWPPSALRDAALLTLDLMEEALKSGLWLKDASAYNILFDGQRPVFIDHLSFQRRPEGVAWPGYQQFCRQFLAPLALAAHLDPRCLLLLQVDTDGLPLDLASRVLPLSSWLNPGLLAHVHLHAKAQQRSVRSPRVGMPRSVGPLQLRALVDHLRSTVADLSTKMPSTPWVNYDPAGSYETEAHERKQALVLGWVRARRPRLLWDLGANSGFYGLEAARLGGTAVAADADIGAVESIYRAGRPMPERSPIALWLDLLNPSPALGLGNEERSSFLERGPADVVLALAVIHHLALGRNVPLDLLARLFARAGRALVLEFVPKGDPRSRQLLMHRDDISAGYDEAALCEAFGVFFRIIAREPLPGSERVLFLMERRDCPENESQTRTGV